MRFLNEQKIVRTESALAQIKEHAFFVSIFTYTKSSCSLSRSDLNLVTSGAASEP